MEEKGGEEGTVINSVFSPHPFSLPALAVTGRRAGQLRLHLAGGIGDEKGWKGQKGKEQLG